MMDRDRQPPPGSGGDAPRRGAGPLAPRSPAAYAGLGIQLAASILVCLYAGMWLDRKLGTSPFMLILGVFVGAGAGFYSLYRALTTTQREQRDRTHE